MLKPTDAGRGGLVGVILNRLRQGVPSQDMRSPFDPRSRWAYAIVGIMAAAASSIMFLTGLSLDQKVLLALPVWPLLVIPAGMLARRVGHDRIGSALELLAFAYTQGLIGAWLTYALTPWSAPLADELLVRADHALGFDWLEFFRWNALDLHRAYSSFLVQPALILFGLFVINDYTRAWRFITAATLALAITAAIYPLAPALDPYWYYGIKSALAHDNGAIRSGEVILALKGGERLITPQMFAGLVCFPSYHSGMAVIFAWAAWANRWFRWPILVLNLLMAYSTIITGGHYLVDVLAGFVVALISIMLVRQFVGDNSLVKAAPAADKVSSRQSNTDRR